jgi:preprotein translocase subunit SecG
MHTLLIIVFVIVCFLLTFVILIQSSKGHGLAGTFGGSAMMGSVFGGRGSAPFLTKITAVLAGLFLIIALVMGMVTKGSVGQSSLIERERERALSSPARTLPKASPATDNASQSAPPPAPQK